MARHSFFEFSKTVVKKLIIAAPQRAERKCLKTHAAEKRFDV